MIKQNLLCIFIGIIIFFSTVDCTTQQACENQTNTNCQACLEAGNCVFCKTNKKCFLFDPTDISDSKCSMSNRQVQTCVGNFRVWIIIVIVLVAVILIALFIVVCCFCRKCKKRRVRREERRQDVDNQRMEERRAAAEVRTSERNRVADQIRMKYGILKEKDNSTDYARMS